MPPSSSGKTQRVESLSVTTVLGRRTARIDDDQCLIINIDNIMMI